MNKDIGEYFPEIYSYPVRVEQILSIKDYDSDTLNLALKETTYFSFNPDVFLRNCEVNQYDENSEIPRPLKFDLHKNGLQIYLTSKTCNVSIKYNLSSDFCFRVPSKSWVYMQLHFSAWQSWYFTADNIDVDNADFYTSDDVYAYETERKGRNHFHSKFDKLSSGRLSFILLNERFYDSTTITSGNIKVDCKFNKNLINDTIYVGGSEYYAILPDENKTQEQIRYVQNTFPEMLDRVTGFFDNSGQKNITIADGDILFADTNEAIYKWGSTIDCGYDNY